MCFYKKKEAEAAADNIGAGMTHLLFKFMGLTWMEGPFIFFYHHFYTILHIGEWGGIIMLALFGLGIIGTGVFFGVMFFQHPHFEWFIH